MRRHMGRTSVVVGLVVLTIGSVFGAFAGIAYGGAPPVVRDWLGFSEEDKSSLPPEKRAVVDRMDKQREDALKHPSATRDIAAARELPVTPTPVIEGIFPRPNGRFGWKFNNAWQGTIGSETIQVFAGGPANKELSKDMSGGVQVIVTANGTPVGGGIRQTHAETGRLTILSRDGVSLYLSSDKGTTYVLDLVSLKLSIGDSPTAVVGLTTTTPTTTPTKSDEATPSSVP